MVVTLHKPENDGAEKIIMLAIGLHVLATRPRTNVRTVIASSEERTDVEFACTHCAFGLPLKLLNLKTCDSLHVGMKLTLGVAVG